jgi:hypothetical protein
MRGVELPQLHTAHCTGVFSEQPREIALEAVMRRQPKRFPRELGGTVNDLAALSGLGATIVFLDEFAPQGGIARIAEQVMIAGELLENFEAHAVVERRLPQRSQIREPCAAPAEGLDEFALRDGVAVYGRDGRGFVVGCGARGKERNCNAYKDACEVEACLQAIVLV